MINVNTLCETKSLLMLMLPLCNISSVSWHLAAWNTYSQMCLFVFWAIYNSKSRPQLLYLDVLGPLCSSRLLSAPLCSHPTAVHPHPFPLCQISEHQHNDADETCCARCSFATRWRTEEHQKCWRDNTNSYPFNIFRCEIWVSGVFYFTTWGVCKIITAKFLSLGFGLFVGACNRYNLKDSLLMKLYFCSLLS